MTEIISVITPVHAPSIPYLAEAYESLAAQELPAGWEWQWLVQDDGRCDEIAKDLPSDPRISHGTGRVSGPAITRNMALARAEGSLVRVLDADDKLLPGALARNIEALTERPEIGWTTSRVLDLMAGGSTVSWEHADPAGANHAELGPSVLHRASVPTSGSPCNAVHPPRAVAGTGRVDGAPRR